MTGKPPRTSLCMASARKQFYLKKIFVIVQMIHFNGIKVFPNRCIQCKHLYINQHVCKHAQHFILHMKMRL